MQSDSLWTDDSNSRAGQTLVFFTQVRFHLGVSCTVKIREISASGRLRSLHLYCILGSSVNLLQNHRQRHMPECHLPRVARFKGQFSVWDSYDSRRTSGATSEPDVFSEATKDELAVCMRTIVVAGALLVTFICIVALVFISIRQRRCKAPAAERVSVATIGL